VRINGTIAHDAPALTSGGDLPCQHIIHAVGPVWGEGDEDRKLQLTVQSALCMAEQNGFKSIALPALSTGVYGFPKDRAARVILGAVFTYFEARRVSTLRHIEITLFDEASVEAFSTEFDTQWSSPR
jgi:O-acetyl-ADP-ribose deacetylase (regulator of RNase III)